MTTFSIATVLVPLVLWLPGAVVWVLVHGGGTRVGFRAYAWVYGLALLFAHYLVHEVLLDQLLGIRTGDGVALALYLVAVGGLAGATLARGRGGALWRLMVDARTALLPYLGFAVLCATLASHDVTHPLPRLEWHHVARKTFGVQTTHDNWFQFVNGKAIAEHLPFATFYDDEALVYPVTSRGILPGVLYSTWRHLVGGLRPSWADRFAWYLLFGIALNAMVIFPLDALRLRLGLRLSPWLLFGLYASSALFLVNGYYTWFKLSGAAFFLAGIVALLTPARWQSWTAAGVLWGVSASMHQGNALGFPIVALWALARTPAGVVGRLGLAAALGVAFVAVMAPWQLVMAFHFPPDLLLVAGHYLDGHFGETLGETLRTFVTATSWQAQVSHRLASLVVALRGPESLELLAGWTWSPAESFAATLPRFRFGYAAIALYPAALGALLARVVGHARPPGRDASGLLAAVMLSLVGAVLAHYSWWYADWVPHLPLGPLVLASVLLADRCVGWRWTHAALIAFVLFEGTITLGGLATGAGQEMLAARCAKPGICGHDLMLHDPESFWLWEPSPGAALPASRTAW